MTPPAHPTVEAKWHSKTRPTRDGHLLWTGGTGHSGTPVLDYRKKRYQAARIAFSMRTGREPEGVVLATCDVPLCVHPRHVQDLTERMRDRAVLRQLLGFAARPDTCAGGHDQNAHGRYDNAGHAYCNACNQQPNQRRKQGAAA